ncbi:MAG: DnaJ domain-containing protein [Leptolyngbyaceae cyanobacterium MO_188.B28]|nr:DnaJ domain-containing protein [Leptolyngbyaceae cyanobacterium MO_188.B28]
MTDHYERLGLTPDATPAQIKTAYHTKLREFPAHTHPQEFKAVRAAYEALRKGGQKQFEDFFAVQPIQASLDPQLLQQLKQNAIAQIDLSLEELIKLTF